MTRTTPLAGFALFLCVAGYVAGCAAKQEAPRTRPMTAAQRSDKAMQDPFGYSPDFSDTEGVGGGTAEFDRKGLRRDLGNVIDP